ncbi:hypothetical protein [Parashewanella tropica]|uniref:hypothetical protein n=1 Tax=Parashewanella tropica TaxID=2547970 RepID=UPI001059CB6D|nr:hypothetical protein [Parashewanella tropica]
MVFKRLLFLAILLTASATQAQGLHQKQTIISSTNFSNFSSGQDYCKWGTANNPELVSCYPVANNDTRNFIKVKEDAYGQAISVSPGSVFCDYDTVKVDSIHATISNINTGHIIYSGPINNMEGLSCKSTECTAWK